jgi:hypothetical protein
MRRDRKGVAIFKNSRSALSGVCRLAHGIEMIGRREGKRFPKTAEI